MHTMTRATRNGESDPTECTAQRLGLMRRVNDGTATPSRRRFGSGPVSTAETGSQCSRL